MEDNYFESQRFENIDFTEKPLVRGEYENCKFINCNLGQSDLSGIKFMDCNFKGSNLSLIKVNSTSFQTVFFEECKMIGVHFNNCDKFALSLGFVSCQLNDTSFYTLKLKKTRFKNCMINNSDFAEADLTESLFDNCELRGTLFDGTILERADLRSAYNYSIDPERNNIKAAKFSTNGLSGLLGKYGIIIED